MGRRHSDRCCTQSEKVTSVIIIMKRYRCPVCGYIYDPKTGDESRDVPPGTAFEDLPSGWPCPVCGATRDEFEEYD